MNGIRVREDEPFEKAIKRFTKSCERAGILSDVKKFRHFEKPSEEKKRKLNAAKRKRMRDDARRRGDLKPRAPRAGGRGGAGGGGRSSGGAGRA